MNDASTPRRTPWLPLLGLAIILASAVAAIALIRNERAASLWVAHSIRSQLAISRFEEEVSRYEASYRGYLLRPTANLVRDMRDSRLAVAETLAVVGRETANDPVQAEHVARLRQLVWRKVAVGEAWVHYKRIGRLEQAMTGHSSQPGWRLSKAIHAEAAAMTRNEQRLLERRQDDRAHLARMIGIGLALAVIAVLAVAWLMVREAETRSREMAAARDDALAARRRAEDAAAAQAVAEAQLRQMQKMEAVGQLTGGIAHDFNNMMAIVIGSLELAERRIGDPDRLRRAIANARDGAERAAALTGRLLAFSRQSPLAPVAIDVNRLVSGMSELLRRTLGEEIAVETVLAGGLWPTFADPGEIENALLNLAVNARDAMAGRPNARLTIETANTHFDDATAGERGDMAPGQYVMIGVTDTGTGMPPAVIARAFDPFFTTKGVGKGTGLGLSQVFGFAKQSRGHASIYSEAGHGTTVKLYLPRHAGAVPAVPVRIAEAAVTTGSADEIVLVCEDEARVRHFSVDALRELGYTALSAIDGEDALRILHDTPSIALLFTDIVMPGISGRELADRAQAIRPALKVLFTTGYTRNAVVHNGMLDPGVAFLAKPFTIGQMAAKVRAVLDGGGVNRAG